jgi:hypothetical protein
VDQTLTPDIQAREGVGGTTCVPRDAPVNRRPSRATGAFLENPAVAVGIVEGLAVGFDHRTSREGDPLLHTHLVVANRVQGPDGRWRRLPSMLRALPAVLGRERVAGGGVLGWKSWPQIPQEMGLGVRCAVMLELPLDVGTRRSPAMAARCEALVQLGR